MAWIVAVGRTAKFVVITDNGRRNYSYSKHQQDAAILVYDDAVSVARKLTEVTDEIHHLIPVPGS